MLVLALIVHATVIVVIQQKSKDIEVTGDNALRAAGGEGVIETKDVVSFASLLDLPSLPPNVIEKVLCAR